MTIDFTRFEWKVAPDGSFSREAAAGELMEIIWRGLDLGDYVLIFTAELSFSNALPLPELLKCMRDAWMALRFDVPTIAAHTVYDNDGNIHIVYKPVGSANEAKAWASSTVRLQEDFADVEDFRHSLSCKPIRDDNGDQTFLYVLPHQASNKTCSILLHTSHITFDTKGLQAVFTQFMKKLVTFMSTPPREPGQELDWGTEARNLLPSPYGILCSEEIREGPVYDGTFMSVITDLVESKKREHGFKPRISGRFPLETKRATATLTEAESQRLFGAIEPSSRPVLIRISGHAAVTLVCAEDNPVPEDKRETAVFAYSQMMDTRPRLRQPYNERDQYPGFCLGVSPLLIPASVVYDPAVNDTKGRLLRVAHATKDEYLRQKAYKSLLAISPASTEVMINAFRQNTPTSFVAVPWYSGDGRGELYLDPTYPDSNGSTLVEITSFVTSVNKFDPGPFFRVWSWRDRLTISADYNPRSMPQDIVEGFVKRWVELVSLLIHDHTAGEDP
ncbi:uncharacterized protein FIBRA_08509 [Fibroporia radiculosa]|uniref:Condensation domain-containing protein n=1 Tax=Fibroporia radiculosa TaxID=599839 RepID=J4H577_9APHY|nr:uncharacterized protein FIBRA_08509 [Fibroporia radiculosa]CCM06259.1 predicted protein [Fibroporia radiculosa]